MGATARPRVSQLVTSERYHPIRRPQYRRRRGNRPRSSSAESTHVDLRVSFATSCALSSSSRGGGRSFTQGESVTGPTVRFLGIVRSASAG
jgi:hypothetical protein